MRGVQGAPRVKCGGVTGQEQTSGRQVRPVRFAHALRQQGCATISATVEVHVVARFWF